MKFILNLETQSHPRAGRNKNKLKICYKAADDIISHTLVSNGVTI